MDTRLLIVPATEGYRVHVLAPGKPTRSWLKVYRTKSFCICELLCAELISAEESEEALSEDFDCNCSMLVFQKDVPLDVLRAIGFVEQKIYLVN